MYWYRCCKDVSYKQESEQSTRTTYVTQLIDNLSEYVLKTRVGYTLLSFLDLRLLFFVEVSYLKELLSTGCVIQETLLGEPIVTNYL